MTLLLVVMVLSVMFGGGMVLLIGSVATPPAPLQVELDRLGRNVDIDGNANSLTGRLGRIGGDAPAADLAVLGWTNHEWYRRRLVFAGAGVVIGCLVACFLRLFVEFSLYLAVPALGLIVGLVAVLVAEGDRATKAEQRRDEIRLALTHFLEITSIMLAGGAGAETALEEAVVRGNGLGFRLFAREIAKAGENPAMSPFSAIRDLGARLGMPELVEFGNVMILSSENAATVRKALDDKAALIIFRDQEKRKVDALSRNVMMSLPVVGMAGGFILWLMYAALAGLANL
jgi:Flp pilus assembly protein TadB